jgi:predicted NUDIX family NTP pyrophosphohydrolase
MPKLSAGILRYKWVDAQLYVLLVHPGGPFWQNKDLGSWSVPKGEYGDGEDALAVAKREFTEETGIPIGEVGDFLGEIKQPSGKRISAWLMEGDCSVDHITSNTFSMEWPRRTGTIQEFPEVDAAEWFPVEVALTKILKGQKGFIDLLAEKVNYTYSSSGTPEGNDKVPDEQGSLFD